MRLRPTAFVVLGLLLAVPLHAQDVAQPSAPPPTDVRLLDKVPNYAQILRHQWSAGVPKDVIEAESSNQMYGGLLGKEPLQATSLADCIALAIQNNTNLQIQRLGPVSATAQVRSARSIFDPKLYSNVVRDRYQTPAVTFLNAGASPTYFTQDLIANVGLRKTLLSGGQIQLEWDNKKYGTVPSLANPIVPQYTTSLGLTLTQPLLRDFGWKYALLMVEIAQNTEQAAYFQYEASISNLVAQVEAAYWALVLAIENVRVQEEGVNLGLEVQRQNEGKFNVGALAHTAVLEAQADVARREALLIRARNAEDIARDNLRALINYRQPNSSTLLMIEPHDQPTAAPYPANLEASLQTALEKRPELTAARLGVYGSGLQRKVAENQLLPRLNFVGQLGLNGLAGTDQQVVFNGTVVPVNPIATGGYGTALGQLPDGRFYNYSAGATIEIPIDNAQAKANYATANINLDQSRLSLQQLQESVTLEIKTAVTNIHSDLKSIQATRLARELEEENVRNQQARYNVGLATTKDLLDFQDRLTVAQFNEIQAVTQYNTDLAELHRVEGTLLSARNILLERLEPEKAPWWASF